MPVEVPAEESVELYNRLTQTAPSDVASVDRILWRLRAIRRRAPSDMSSAVALLQALAIRGQASEAIALAQEIWPRRWAIKGDVAVTFGSILAQIGLYEEAIQFVRQDERRSYDRVEASALVHAAWGAGRYDDLMYALRFDHGLAVDWWGQIFDQFRASGLLPYFADRQRIIHEHLFGRQCGVYLLFNVTGGPSVELTHYVFTDADHGERSTLADFIYDEMASFFGGKGVSGVDFWSCAPVIILDQKARPSLWEESQIQEFDLEPA